MPKFLLTKCLTWEELSQEQRLKILDMNRDIDLDMLTSEDIIWELSEAGNKVADAGFLNPEFEYCYSYSQGDGACFDCEMFNWELLLEDLDIPHKKFFIKYLEEGTNIDYGIRRPNASYAYHYSHERCRKFFIDAQYGWPSRVCEIYEKIEQHIETKRLDLCRVAFTDICNAIDWAQSDEHLMERFQYCDYYYREDTLQVADDTKLIEIPV